MCESHKNQNQECTEFPVRKIRHRFRLQKCTDPGDRHLFFRIQPFRLLATPVNFFSQTKNATTGSTTINTYRRIFSSVRRLSLVPIYEPANAQATAGIASFQRILIDLQIPHGGNQGSRCRRHFIGCQCKMHRYSCQQIGRKPNESASSSDGIYKACQKYQRNIQAKM